MSDILAEAASIVDGERQRKYGPPADNFARIAALWTAYLDGRGLIDLNKTDGITPTDFALMQALVKIARLEHGYHHDSVVDLAGYAACAAQINEPPLTLRPARCPWVTGLGHCVLSALHPGDHVGERGEDRNKTSSGSETAHARAKRLDLCDFPCPAGPTHCQRPTGHDGSHGYADATW